MARTMVNLEKFYEEIVLLKAQSDSLAKTMRSSKLVKAVLKAKAKPVEAKVETVSAEAVEQVAEPIVEEPEQA